MKAVFLRALEEVADKSAVLREAVMSPEAGLGRTRFEVETETFGQIPRSPFAYWVSDRMRGLFAEFPAFESGGRTAKQGLATADDFQFVRLWMEIGPREIARQWFPFAKGGKFAQYYADVPLVVQWANAGRAIVNFTDPASGRLLSRPQNIDYSFRPGLTWSDRTTKLFSTRIWPAGGIFSVKGSAGFVPGDEFFALGVTNSLVFNFLLSLLVGAGDAAARSYQVGTIGLVPWPDTDQGVADLAWRAWADARSLDKRSEDSHAFLLPALLQLPGGEIRERAKNWADWLLLVRLGLERTHAEINELCFNIYGIDSADRQQIEQSLASKTSSDGADDDNDAEDAEAADFDAVPLVASLLSWTVGVAYGRFDLRLATGERPTPPEPEPFDPLPVCSPGMLTGKDGLPVDAPPQGYPIHFPRDGILVDDPGAPRDLVTACRQVFDPIFDDPADRWDEAAEILGDRATGLRSWLAQQLFEQHIKRYSKSRRKAPIYWQLATPSASYSVWLYYHRFTRDTLFRVLNDHVAPKLQHEERKMNSLRQEAGLSPSNAQRRAIEAQEAFVGELQVMRDEVARVAPLWNPNLNDGVILNFAPLWRLVPQHKTWQKECKSAWDKLCKGDYDWAHLAMHLWPERVVPKCAKDRSLAIAHGLEDAFWHEGADGKWKSRKVGSETVEQLIAERTIPAVKSALDDLMSAPAPTGGRRRRTRS